MNVEGLVWAGTRTERYAEMVAFLRDVLGLALEYDDGAKAVLRFPDGKLFEVFGPGDTEHPHFSTGPVVEFGVDDIDRARADLEQAGVEVLSSGASGDDAWAHFRAPDGNVYELTARPVPGPAAPSA